MEFDEGCDDGNVDLEDDVNLPVMNTANYNIDATDINQH